jgi:hypothetical protein
MRGGALGRTSLVGRRWLVRHLAPGLLVLLALTLVLGLVPGVASAESLCTDTWTGGGGEWGLAGNWSTKEVPTSASVACIGSGESAHISSGSYQVGVVQGEGSLVVSGGSLELANAVASSTITDFSLFGGSLTGAGSLEVTGYFDWEGTGTVSGSGSLVIAATAEGHIHGYSESSESMLFSRALLVNEGTLRFNSGTLYMSEGAEFENKGTFEPSSSQERAPYGAAIERPGSEGAAPLIVNTGEVKKIEGSTTKIDVRLENRGSIRLEVGNIELLAGGSATEGSWSTSACGCTFIFGGSGSSYSLVGGSLSGAVLIGGPAVSVEKVGGAGASVTVTSGSLSLAAGYTTFGGFSLFGGSLTGVGTLDVLSSLNWEGTSTISGTGSLVLEAGGTGRIHRYNESTGSAVGRRKPVGAGTGTPRMRGIGEL